jgi:UDP-N-acetylmuramate dehydrogenase
VIVKSDFPLKEYNTFGIAARAKHFVSIATSEELVQFLTESELRQELKLVLGGGSNMLLTQDVDGTVLHINISGKRFVEETETHAIVEAGAGENWHEVVLWALDHDLGGIENLSLIPGNIGTAPVQNIGAYGVELKDTFHSLQAVSIADGRVRSFSLDECQFGYRDSVFKNAAKGNYIITSVQLKLNKPPFRISTHYGAIQAELEKTGITNPSIVDVSKAVIAIRQSKLPDPKVLGNSGSFFKNPILTSELANSLKKNYPELPVYDAAEGFKKVAAGWLIEKAGLKGYRDGDAGVHAKQALVLVNYGSATGSEILALSKYVIATVKTQFGITLEAEVNII